MKITSFFLVILSIHGGGLRAGELQCAVLQRGFGLESKAEIVPAETTEAQKLLQNSALTGNDVQLHRIATLYETQLTPNLCSVASGSVAIRVLREKPFRQNQFLTESTEHIQKSSPVKVGENTVRDLPNGQTLLQLATMLEKAHGLKVEAKVVSDSLHSLTEFRENLRKASSDPKLMMIVNYQESLISKEFPNGGHFSPVAAFDPATDRVLIADVFQSDRNATVQSSWFWVKTEVLYRALNSYDRDAKQNRGYLMLR